jgi:hypothetical protein
VAKKKKKKKKKQVDEEVDEVETEEYKQHLERSQLEVEL